MSGDRLSQWQSASPYLDTALDLPPDERAAWLAELRQTSPAIAAEIERWLNECALVEATEFLERDATPDPSRAALAGVDVGAYRLTSLVGHGGMGTVWLAERTDGRFTGRVAVKLLNPALVGRRGEERFAQEGRILARLTHPGIARLVDAGVTGIGQPYLALEFVDGVPIDRHCDARRLDVEARLRLVLDVLDAVQVAHNQLVVHRDIKPSNVMVTTDGIVKLLDFGIARLLQPDALDTAGLTRDSQAMLTPAYAAPEQVNNGDITVATDVYALGVLVYLLLTGRHPAEPELSRPASLIRAITDVDPPLMSTRVVDADPRLTGTPAANAEARAATPARLRETLRGDLDAVVAKALAKAPAARYASAAVMADDLRRHLERRPVLARRITAGYRLRRFVARNRVAVGLSAVAATALVAGTAATVIQARRVAVERDFALRQLSRAESIVEMNRFLLTDAAPMGQPFTAGTLLRRAEELLTRRAAVAVDQNVVESLAEVGFQYWSQDEDDNARRVLTQAYELSRRLPASAASTRAKAGCSLASALARGVDIPRARQLITEALAEMPAGESFTLDHVACLKDAARVAREAGDSAADLRYLEEARVRLEASGLGSDNSKLSLVLELADASRTAGRSTEASRLFEDAFAQLTSLGRDRTEEAGTLLNNWGLALSFLGRPRDAEKAYRQAVEISQATADGESVSPMLLLNLARPVLELDHADEAIALVERALAEARRLKDEVVKNQALLFGAVAYRAKRDATRATALLDEADTALRQVLPPDHPAFGAIAEQRAEDLERAGRLAEARVETDRAMAYATGSSQGAGLVRTVLYRRASIALASGNAAAAVEDAQAVVQQMTARLGTGIRASNLGRVHLFLGRAQLAAGRRADARTSFEEAAAHFDATLTPDHRESREARDWLARASQP